MLKARIVPTLLYKDFGLVKGIAFDSLRAVGSPMQAIKVYELRQVDELVFFDVTATRQGRGPDLELIDDLADECFMPLTVGGGVRSVQDVYELLQVGADKVCIGSAAVEHPEIIDQAASRFGTQCVVVSIDTRLDPDGGSSVWVRSATEATALDPVALAKEVEDRGAGELIVQSIDRDGTMTGYDLKTLGAIADAVSIPVVASGGAGSYEDMYAAFTTAHVSAVAAASIYHFTHQTPLEAKEHLRARGVPVRR